VETSYLRLTGRWQIINTIEERRGDGVRAEILAFIPCRARPKQPRHRKIMEKLCRPFPGRVTPVAREDESVAAAPASGLPVTACAPGSTGAEEYRAAARFLTGLLPRPQA
jgi:cellulose biosynthesis protein BcsQ